MERKEGLRPNSVTWRSLDALERSPNGRRRLGTVNLPKLVLPKPGSLDTPSTDSVPGATAHNTAKKLEADDKNDLALDSSKDSGSTDLVDSKVLSQIPSYKKKFITTPVLDIGSNPCLYRLTKQELPVKKPVLLRAVSTPSEAPCEKLNEEEIVKKRKNFSTNSRPQNLSSVDESNATKRLSQLFIPPSSDDLLKEKLLHESEPDSPKPQVSSSVNSIKSDRTVSRDNLPKVESPLLTKSRTPGRKIDLRSPMLRRKIFKEGSKKDSFFGVKITDENGVLEKLLKFKKNPSNDDDASDDAEALDVPPADDAYSFNDTIVSNRSAYFKQYYTPPDATDPRTRLTWSKGPNSNADSEKNSSEELKKKKKRPYQQIFLALLLFVSICAIVSCTYYYYHLHMLSVFIFDRIKVIEKSRTMQILSSPMNNTSLRKPLAQIKLGVTFPIKTTHIDCTDYLKYLTELQEKERTSIVYRKKRSLGTRNLMIDSYNVTENMNSIASSAASDDKSKVSSPSGVASTEGEQGGARGNHTGMAVKVVSEETLSLLQRIISEQNDIQKLFAEMECVDYRGKGRLQLTHRPMLPEVDCFSVHWEASSRGQSMKDCFLMDNSHTGVWWGMGDVTGGSLPLSSLSSISNVKLYTGEIQRHLLGGLVRKAWISSKGILITMPFASKSSFSVEPIEKSNHTQFCFTSDPGILSEALNEYPMETLDYSICVGDDVHSLYRQLRRIETMDDIEFRSSKWHTKNRRSLEDLREIPNPPKITRQVVDEVIERFNCPIWRPWIPHYLEEIDQESVLTYANYITENSMSVCGHILLPETWQDKLGHLEFDSIRFPDPKAMIDSLLRKGLRLALTLTPLIDTDTSSFRNTTVSDLLIRQINSTLPILISTNHATAAGVLDFTNYKTVNWFAEELKRLNETYGIDRFHISPVNTNSLPPFRQHHSHHENPDHALGQFILSVSKVRAPISTDTAIIPVNPPTFLAAGDGDAGWGMLEMLPNRILSISAVGGNLVDSGVIGGWSNQKGHIPDRELFLRWMETSTFLPAAQISTLPSMYDPMLRSLATDLIQVRKKYVIPRFKKGLNESLQHGYPLVSSLALVYPDDLESLPIRDQWFIGEDLMVAPILYRGARARDIYLPPGIWKDALDDRLLKGGKWIRSYVVSLGKVPHFFLLIHHETGEIYQKK